MVPKHQRQTKKPEPVPEPEKTPEEIIHDLTVKVAILEKDQLRHKQYKTGTNAEIKATLDMIQRELDKVLPNTETKKEEIAQILTAKDERGKRLPLCAVIRHAYEKLKGVLLADLDYYLKRCQFSDQISDDSLTYLTVKYKSCTSPFETNEDGSVKDPNEPVNGRLCCMWDTEPIEKHPIFLPDKFVNDVFHCSHFFCSMNCAIAYILAHPETNTGEQLSLLKYLYNCPVSETILPAPTMQLLNKFGGPMTIQQYRTKLMNYRALSEVPTGLYIRKVDPVIAYVAPYIEETIADEKKLDTSKYVR